MLSPAHSLVLDIVDSGLSAPPRRALQQLGHVGHRERFGYVLGAGGVLEHHETVGTGGGDLPGLDFQRLFQAHVVDAPAGALLVEGVAAAGATAHGTLAVTLHLAQLDAWYRLQRGAGLVVDVVVAPEIAWIVVGYRGVQ